MTEILNAVRAATVSIRAAAPDCERAGCLTEPVVATISDAGGFRMAWSRSRGGPELSPLEQIEVIEELAAADGSAGWCAMINSDGGYLGAMLDPTVSAEMYPSLDLATSVVATPSGRATIDGDGFRVAGQWAFASGSTHCAWFFVGCLVFDGDEMQVGPDGMPTILMFAVPAPDVEILDTWQTTGLNATASNDIRVANVFVPCERTCSLLNGDAIDPSPLYSWRWNFFINVSGVPLGVARAALANACEVAETKIGMPSFAPIREEATVQHNVGLAAALTHSARAYVFDAVGGAWTAMQSGRPPSPAEWREVRLATTHAMQSSKQAVTLLYEALGTTGVYRTSVLDRQFRDLTTMSQHLIAQTKTYAAAGRGFLGLDPAAIAF